MYKCVNINEVHTVVTLLKNIMLHEIVLHSYIEELI